MKHKCLFYSNTCVRVCVKKIIYRVYYTLGKNGQGNNYPFVKILYFSSHWSVPKLLHTYTVQMLKNK